MQPVAERFAQKLGGYYRFLHLPDGLSGAAADELARLPQVREPLELVRHADVLLYGIGRAMDLAQRRGLSRVEQETLREEGAVAEALGFYLSADGRVVGGGSSLAFKPEDIGRKNRAAAVAAREGGGDFGRLRASPAQAAGRRRGRGAADDRAFAPINAKFWKSAPFFAQIFDNLGKKCYTRSVRTGRDPAGKRFETPRLPRLSPGGVFWGRGRI